jgi:hypothetical protein
MSPKNTGIKAGIVIAAVTTVLFVVIANLLLPSRLAPTAGDYRSHYATLYPTTIEGLAASCGDINYFGNLTSRNYAVLPQGIYDNKSIEVPRFETVLPVAGYMAPTVLDKSAIKYYALDDDPHYTEAQILRLQYERNTIVIWYSPGVAPEEITSIRKLMKANGNIMVLPWTPADHKNAELPEGRNLAFTAWGTNQSCFAWNPAVFFNFSDFTKQHPIKRSAEARTAKLNAAGKLPPVDSIILSVLDNARRRGATGIPAPSASATPSPTQSQTGISRGTNVQQTGDQGSGVHLPDGREVVY